MEPVLPLSPPIKKTTAIAAIRARFPDNEAILRRFEIAKDQANKWDGERDGLREVVKLMPAGKYGRMVLSWSTTAAVLYPNPDGKHQIENCLQVSIPAPKFYIPIPPDEDGVVPEIPPGVVRDSAGVVALQLDGVESPDVLLDTILHYLQKGKDQALAFLAERWLGSGDIVNNGLLFEKKGSEKSALAEIPEEI